MSRKEKIEAIKGKVASYSLDADREKEMFSLLDDLAKDDGVNETGKVEEKHVDATVSKEVTDNNGEKPE